MKKYILLLFVLLFSACSAEQPPIAIVEPVVEEVDPMDETPVPTVTMEEDEPAEPPITEIEEPTSTTEESANIPDLSSVSLFEATHLMDPSNFQVSLEGWPVEFSDALSVVVGDEMFSCDLLFPDEFPERAYCWGKTPGRPGEQIMIKLYYSGVEDPLAEIEFRIPSPGAGGGG
jgi:hypothetical protein